MWRRHRADARGGDVGRHAGTRQGEGCWEYWVPGAVGSPKYRQIGSRRKGIFWDMIEAA
jgi:hypothetical protein